MKIEQLTATPDDSSHIHHSQEAKRVTYIGAWLDGLLSVVKVVVGFLVGSAALIADGIHSCRTLSLMALFWPPFIMAVRNRITTTIMAMAVSRR